MKNFFGNLTSMRSKLGLVIGISTFLIASILIAYTTIIARDHAIRAARENAMAVAKDYAGQVQADMEKALTSARTLAQTFSAKQVHTNPLSLSRDEAHTIFKEILLQNESFYGAYTCWEPNAFDGMDEAYKNFDPAHDSTGRFIPYWFKENGELLLETTQGYSKDTYYTIPETTKAETIIDPVTYTVNGSRISLVTIVAPILNNNRQFYGITGIDIATDWMQQMVKSARLYNGHADINIISHNGTIAASTMGDTLVGQNIREAFPDYTQQIASLAKGDEGSVLSDQFLKVHAPVFIGNSNTPWQVSIKVPSELILAEANSQMWKMIFISFALLIFSLAIILVIVQRLIKPLESMVRITERVAEGDLSYQEIKTGKDEIGQMNDALGRLMEGLRKTTDFANQIGKGNLEAEYSSLGEKDTLGQALLSMRSSLQEIAEEDRKRNWVTEGLTQFGDILRNNNDELSTLADNIITALVKYLGANQGGMFILRGEGEEKQLELVATYAWNRKRFRDKIMSLGQGLAGQAVLEKEYIYMTEVPRDYVSITSGLGDANPSAILIMPLKVNEEVMGIIELASFKPFEQYQIDFVAKVGESIASTLSSVQINQTTRKLLEEARISAEEIRAAEEELKQNQEELEATQEEMHRTIEELRRENKRLQEERAPGAAGE